MYGLTADNAYQSKKPSHEIEGTGLQSSETDLSPVPCEGTDLGKGLQKTSAVLKVPKSTVASIIIKCKEVWKQLFLELPDWAKLSNRVKGRGKRGDQEPDGHSGGAPEILCGDGRKFQKDNHHHQQRSAMKFPLDHDA